jgi:hypothetical protein
MKHDVLAEPRAVPAWRDPVRAEMLACREAAWQRLSAFVSATSPKVTMKPREVTRLRRVLRQTDHLETPSVPDAAARESVLRQAKTKAKRAALERRARTRRPPMTTPPAAPPTPEERLAELHAAEQAQRDGALQPWLDHVAPAAAQIEPLRLKLQAERQTHEADVLRWQHRLRDRVHDRLTGIGTGTVANTRALVSEWIGLLTSGLGNLTSATRALEELRTVPVKERPSKAGWILEYVERAKNCLDGCAGSFWKIELSMKTIDTALERGQLLPDPELALARKYGPPDEAA